VPRLSEHQGDDQEPHPVTQKNAEQLMTLSQFKISDYRQMI
jgi:hypothetical protein